MATQAQRRQWREAVEAALNERDAAERYRIRQRELRRGRPAAEDRPRPWGTPGFMGRVARLFGRG